MSYFLLQPVHTTNPNNIYCLFVSEPCADRHGSIHLHDTSFKLKIHMYCNVLTCIEPVKTEGPARQEGPKGGE